MNTRGLVVAGTLAAALQLTMPADLDATVSMKLVQAFMTTKHALEAIMQRGYCPTAEEMDRLAEMVSDATKQFKAQIDADQKRLSAVQKKTPVGSGTTAEEQKLSDDIGLLESMTSQLNDLYKEVWKWTSTCPPRPETPPPPPPTRDPEPPPAPPPPPPPTGTAPATPTHRSTSCVRCKPLAEALNDTSDSLLQAQAKNAPNQMQILIEVQRLSKELDACEQACATATRTSMIKKPALIGGAAGGAVLAAVLASHAGGSGPTTSTGNGASLPSSPSFLPFAATMTGTMSLVTDAKTCAGSSPTYTEKAAVALDKTGAGTVQLEAAFVRVYHAMVVNNAFTDNETFAYLGQAVPSSANGTFVFASASVATLTLQETSNWGSGGGACTNVYRGTLR